MKSGEVDYRDRIRVESEADLPARFVVYVQILIAGAIVGPSMTLVCRARG